MLNKNIIQTYIYFITPAIIAGVIHFIWNEYVYDAFFLLAYIWHYTITSTELRERTLKEKARLTFLSTIMRLDYYLQVLIDEKKIPFIKTQYLSGFIRALPPQIFILLLLYLGGSGNLIFSFFGSLLYETLYNSIGRSRRPII